MLLSWSPSALERREQLLLGAARDARTLVDHRDQHPVADLAGVDPHHAVGRVAQCVVDQIGQHPFEQAAVGHHHGVVNLDLDPVERRCAARKPVQCPC